jgi:NADP-dependent 3-hydroxy acid dehydrogenase YdfG
MLFNKFFLVQPGRNAMFILSIMVSCSFAKAKAFILSLFTLSSVWDIIHYPNAGYVLNGAFEDLAIDEIKAEYETNVFGLIRTT